MSILKFNPEVFCARLPLAYYSNNVDLEASPDIINFEANALPCNGLFKLELQFKKGVEKIWVRLSDGLEKEHILSEGQIIIPISIDYKLLSFDFKAYDWDFKELPLKSAKLIDYACGGEEEKEFSLYKRNIKLDACNLLPDGKDSAEKILCESFDLSELLKMRDEIVDWSASRQVMDKNDPHFGAVYSEEDKYCFRDAIFAACCFMRRYLLTDDLQWLERAVTARDYCFKGQYLNTGDSGKDGCWAAMGIIDDQGGKSFRRITDQWAQASGVDTAIIGVQSYHLLKMGMPFTEAQLDQLSAAVNWHIRNAVAPGWFSHHEGMELFCLNVNSLASSMFFAVNQMLIDSGRPGLSETHLNEAELAFSHVLNCQEAIGVYPYRPFELSYKRGGAYELDNFPDNGIGLQAVITMINIPSSPFDFVSLKKYMRRTALWYLFSSRFEGDRLALESCDDPEYLKGLAFGNFTWCRITMLDIISQVWGSIDNTQFWKQFCRAHIRTIRETLWNNNNSKAAPVRRCAVPGVDLNLVSWIQQAEWAAYVFDNLATRYKLTDKIT